MHEDDLQGEAHARMSASRWTGVPLDQLNDGGLLDDERASAFSDDTDEAEEEFVPAPRTEEAFLRSLLEETDVEDLHADDLDLNLPLEAITQMG
jgi:hypothetical protein